MGLKLNGKPFDPNPPVASVSAIVAFLKKAPKNELFTSEQLGKRSGVSRSTLCLRGRDPILAPYRIGRRGVQVLWGNPKAILEYHRLTRGTE